MQSSKCIKSYGFLRFVCSFLILIILNVVDYGSASQSYLAETRSKRTPPPSKTPGSTTTPSPMWPKTKSSDDPTKTKETVGRGTTYSSKTVVPRQGTCFRRVKDFARNKLGCRLKNGSGRSISSPYDSCTGRCGQWPVFNPNLPACACDDICIIYGDCCPDKFILCELTEAFDYYSKAFSQVGPEHSTCVTQQDSVSFDSCRGDKSFAAKETTTMPPLQKEMFQEQTIAGEWKRPPYGPRMLEKYSDKYETFMVADVSNRMVWHPLDTFFHCQLQGAIPHFVPKVITLDCSEAPFERSREHNVLDLLQWCHLGDLRHMRTSLARTCRSSRLITCDCADGTKVADYVYSACAGFDLPMIHLRPNKEWTSYELSKSLCLVSRRNSWLHSSHQNVKTRSSGLLDSPTEHVKASNPITIIVTPSSALSPHINGALEPQKSTDNMFINNNSFRTTQSSFSSWHTVEILGTLERRLRCPDFRSYLRECRLESCTTGALMTSEDLSGRKYANGYSCFRPAFVRVTSEAPQDIPIPRCTCLRIQKALSRLLVWSVALSKDLKKPCQLVLNEKLVMRNQTNANSFWYDFSNTNYGNEMPNENEISLSFKTGSKYNFLKAEDIRKQKFETNSFDLEKMMQRTISLTSDACTDTPYQQIHLCFYPSTSGYVEEVTRPGLCLKLLADVESNSKIAQGISVSSSSFSTYIVQLSSDQSKAVWVGLILIAVIIYYASHEEL